MPINYKHVLEFQRLLLKETLKTGDSAVDATCGNGHDSVFLKSLIGPEGRLFCFDVQASAIEATKNRLESAGLLQNCTLTQTGHENLGQVLDGHPVSAIVFNLGYLPGSDKTVATGPDTTLAAVEAAASHLNKGGLILLVAYPGFDKGREEAERLRAYLKELDQKAFNVFAAGFLNQAGHPPELFAIQKI